MKWILTMIAMALLAIGTFGAVSAHDEAAESAFVRAADDDDDDDNKSARGPVARAISYINPDIGAATANPDVNPASNCARPDRRDTQQLSPAGTGTRNVHNDACLLDRAGSFVDAPVSWESTGAGVIFRCPDPDGAAGPKVAVLSGNRCFQSGFQSTGMAGDGEYHLRLNNTDTPAAKPWSSAGTPRTTAAPTPEEGPHPDPLDHVTRSPAHQRFGIERGRPAFRRPAPPCAIFVILNRVSPPNATRIQRGSSKRGTNAAAG